MKLNKETFKGAVVNAAFWMTIIVTLKVIVEAIFRIIL